MRQRISARRRWLILERDGFLCRYCGRKAGPDVQLHVDHIVPVAHGGSSDDENLVTACRDCNLGKRTNDSTAPMTVAERFEDLDESWHLLAQVGLSLSQEQASALRDELETVRSSYASVIARPRSKPTHIGEIIRRMVH